MRKAMLAAVLFALTVGLVACGEDSSPEGEAASGTQEPVQLRFASYAPPSTVHSEALNWWAEEVEKRTNGAVKVELFFSESLLKGAEVLTGVGQGRADMGYSSDVYFPNELPLTNVVSLPFVTSEGDTQARALNRLYEENEAYRQEWESNGVHLLGNLPTGPNTLFAKEPIDSLDALKQRKIRAVGDVAKHVAAIGVNPVNIPGPEVYEALSRGVVDTAMGLNLDFGMGLKLHEAAPHVYNTGLGNFSETFAVMNLDTWNGLDASTQQTLTELSDELVDQVIEKFHELDEELCQTLEAEGATSGSFPPELVEAWRSAIEREDIVADWQAARPNGQEFYDQYTQLLEELSSQSTYTPWFERC